MREHESDWSAKTFVDVALNCRSHSAYRRSAVNWFTMLGWVPDARRAVCERPRNRVWRTTHSWDRRFRHHTIWIAPADPMCRPLVSQHRELNPVQPVRFALLDRSSTAGVAAPPSASSGGVPRGSTSKRLDSATVRRGDANEPIRIRCVNSGNVQSYSLTVIGGCGARVLRRRISLQ